MSDSADKSLEILIKTKADLKEAVAMRQELERCILRAKLLGKSFADQQASLDRVNAAIKQFTGSSSEGGKELKLFQGHAGEVKKAIRELGEEFPIASKALMLLTNPIGGTLAIAISMFTYMKEKLDDWNKEMDETAERLAKPDFVDAIKARKDALEQGAIAAEQFADKMANLIDPEARYQKTIQQNIDLLNQQAAAVNEVAEAQQSLAQAQLSHGKNLDDQRLKQQLDAGKITLEQFNTAKLALDSAYFAQLTALEERHAAEKFQREKQLRADLLKLDQDALAHAQAAQPGLNNAAATARNQATQSAAAAAKTEAEVTRAQAALPDDKKAEDAAEKALRSMLFWHGYGDAKTADLGDVDWKGIKQSFGMSPNDRDIIDAYLNAHAQHANDLNTAGKADQAAGQRVDASLDESAAARAEARAEANAQRIQDAQDKLNTTTNANAAKDQADQAAAEADAQKRLIDFRDQHANSPIGGGYTIGDEEKFEQIRQTIAAGGRVSDSQRQFFTAFANFINQQHNFHTKYSEALDNLTNAYATAVQKIEAQDTLIAQLTGRLKSQLNR